MQSHDKLASDVQSAGRTGGDSCCLGPAGSPAKSEDDKTALLYNLERGELRMDAASKTAPTPLLADIKVKEWEETAKTNLPS